MYSFHCVKQWDEKSICSFNKEHLKKVILFFFRTSIPEPPANTEPIEHTKPSASKESSVVSGMFLALWSRTQPSRCGVPSGHLYSARRESKTFLNLAR